MFGGVAIVDEYSASHVVSDCDYDHKGVVMGLLDFVKIFLV